MNDIDGVALDLPALVEAARVTLVVNVASF
jgi:hypothetical protein